MSASGAVRSNRAKFGLAAVLVVALTMTGCTTTWISQAEQIVAALLPAAANIVALVAALQGGSVSAQDLQAVQSAGAQASADLQLIQSLIGEYQKASAQAQPGILNEIQAAIGTAQTNLSGILPALHIKDAATQAKITAVVGVVISEMQSLEAVLPLVSADHPTLTAENAVRMGHPADSGAQGEITHISQKQRDMGHPAVRVGHPSVVKTPLSANEFVGSYNATMTAKTGKNELDLATSGLRIHLHSRLARWASAGMLK